MSEVIIVSFIVLIFSIVIHEVSHGSMAYHLGDDTAKRQGRLSLNPLKHIDLMGTILLPLFLVMLNSPAVIGWAKPVPVNFNNLRDRKWGELKVAIAGPLSNLCVALVCALLIRFFTLGEGMTLILSVAVIYNILLALFNLIPVPPLDGSHILFTFLRNYEVKAFLTRFGFFILIFALFFTPFLKILLSATVFLGNFLTAGKLLI
ncbi:site-2 protease family protein [Patescibacteria group bacterium]|jgi:Zn-dependent protease|nr:site-2 protease family protein [Patescibacteria group bacterium]